MAGLGSNPLVEYGGVYDTWGYLIGVRVITGILLSDFRKPPYIRNLGFEVKARLSRFGAEGFGFQACPPNSARRFMGTCSQNYRSNTYYTFYLPMNLQVGVARYGGLRKGGCHTRHEICRVSAGFCHVGRHSAGAGSHVPLVSRAYYKGAS